MAGYKLDLHTHSYGSPDGSLRTQDYRFALEHKLLDYIAITDHNSIAVALKIREELGEFGGRIIIGEEIMTTQGEIIGLYLTSPIRAGYSAIITAREIKNQGGLVYIPHPFQRFRHGLSEQALVDIAPDIDIIEAYNGRALLNIRGDLAKFWMRPYEPEVAAASSSDAHGRKGWGRDYSLISSRPTPGTLVAQLAHAQIRHGKVGVGVAYPKLNRFRKRGRRAHS